MTDPLFTAWKLGNLTLKNRILMPAMHLNMAEDYRISDKLCAFYAARAQGGAGLIGVGYASIDLLAAHAGHIGAHDDSFIPGLTRLAETIHAGGAKAFVQLNHAGRYNHSMLTGGLQPVAPSAVPSRLTNETPRELSDAEIEALIVAFVAAAKRVEAAGFDAVEVLAGTGYLISEFLSPLTNKREDRWGGSLENRMRFGLEVIRAIKLETRLPLLVRINGNDFMPGGIGRETLQLFATELEKAGADALSINVGWHEAQMPQIVTKVPRGAFAYLARNIRQQVSIPVIAGHRINDPQTARELIGQNWCDGVAMGRALIADPELPNKAASGKESQLVHCVACGQGCFDALFKFQRVECLCNPRAGHEDEEIPAATQDPLKVLVVGGGAGGMSAALAAARQGHQVCLCEKADQLGGQLDLAGTPPGRTEFRFLAQDLAHQIAAAGIETRLATLVDRELLKELQPDRVILATGGKPLAPPIPGSELPHVVQAWDLLQNKASAGNRVVVIGGGAVGIETALLLAEEATLPAETLKFLLVHRAEDPEELYRLATQSNREICIVEMIAKIGRNFGKTTRWTMLQDLERYAIKSRTQVKVTRITPAGVMLETAAGQAEELLPADTVVLAVGTRAENPLQALCEELCIPATCIGDARKPAMVFDAVHQGHKAGQGIV